MLCLVTSYVHCVRRYNRHRVYAKQDMICARQITHTKNPKIPNGPETQKSLNPFERPISHFTNTNKITMVQLIEDSDQFAAMLEISKSKLVVVDFFAVW